MKGGLRYGAFLGTMMIALTRWAPQSAGSVVLWTALTAETIVLERVVVWKRLRLPWFAVGGIGAVFACAMMIPISARGFDILSVGRVSPMSLVLFWWSCWVLAPLSVGMETLRGSPEWRAWSERMEHVTLLDMLALRHIPTRRHDA